MDAEARSWLGLATNNLDTQLAALPTDADVQTAAAAALTAYDPPTHAEVTSGFTEIKGATWDSGTDTLEAIRNKETDIETDTQDLQTQVGTDGAGLTSIGDARLANLDAAVSSRSTVTTAEVNAQCDTAISDAALATAAALTTVNNLLDNEIALILAAVDTEVALIKAKTDTLPEGIQNNAALSNFTFFMADSTDHVTGATGLTITATRRLDSGSFAACANSATEVGNGIYTINLADTDLNGDVVTLRFTATGADDTVITIKTEA